MAIVAICKVDCIGHLVSRDSSSPTFANTEQPNCRNQTRSKSPTKQDITIAQMAFVNKILQFVVKIEQPSSTGLQIQISLISSPEVP